MLNYFFTDHLFRVLLTAIIVMMICTHTGAQSFFHDVADSVGIQETYGTSDLNFAVGGGCSFYDFDGDGWDDLSFTSEYLEGLVFYKNMGGYFQLVSPSYVTNLSETKQILWADVDNDGDKDLFVTGIYLPGHDPLIPLSRLYENDGAMNFTDITVSSGLPTDLAPTFGANFGDVNNDGWLDLLIINRSTPPNNSFSAFSNRLFLNDGNGGFSDISLISGIVQDTTVMFCAAFFDMDNDMDQDIYIAHDKYFGNPLFVNQGNGIYSELSGSTGADLKMDAMNVAVGDYDNDGYLDIYITNSIGNPINPNNKLLKNNNGTSFSEVASAVGVDFGVFSWGANWLDVDNDMDLDLYCSGLYLGSSGPSACFENAGNGTFTTTNTMGFVGDTTASFSNAIGDFNNDGYPDIVVNNALPDSMQLWMNQTGSNHWLKVSLEGTISNRDGIGSFIEIYINGNKYIRYTHCGIGYLAQNSGVEIFGLGSHINVDSLKVRWLSGIVDVLYNVGVDQKITVVEASTAIKLSAKVFLEGPFDDVTDLMKDDLRMSSFLPMSEPFTVLGFTHVKGGLETAGPNAFDVAGNDAIVDWVLLELRDKNDNTKVLHTRSALLQRDGDVVDRDGTSPVVFSIAADDYFVVVRHRNHLGIMSNAVVALSTTTTSMNFSDGSILTYGTDAQKDIGGTDCMWTGNVISDDQVKYTGINNDRDAILTAIGGVVPTASISGYHSEDTTLDGLVKYTGLNNDRDIILVNIGGVIPTSTRSEQLP